MNAPPPDLVLPFSALDLEQLPRVGGKNAALGEMTQRLAEAGVAVPDGFALTVECFDRHLDAAGIRGELAALLADLDVSDVGALAATGKRLRALVAGAELPPEVAEAARAAYARLGERAGRAELDVAVRSSATAEDLPEASFAGQQESYLNVHGFDELQRAIRRCMASLYTDRALVYRAERGIDQLAVKLSVGVQRMVRSDLACAGVLFTIDPDSGFPDVVFVTGAFGLGELVVQGRVNPDEYWVHKPTLRRGHRSLLRRECGTKALRMVYAEEGAGGRPVREERVPADERRRFVLDDDEVLQLARWSLAIEDHYGRRAGHPVPIDVEWAKDGLTGELFIVQARPETVHSRKEAVVELFQLARRGEVLVEGRSVGSRIGQGTVRVVRGERDLAAFQPGEVLVTEMTDPDWEPVLARAAAVVTDQGGRTCHAAIVSRELGLPCVVGTGTATHRLADGRVVTVSCAEGEIGRVYDGALPFRRERIDPAEIPASPVPLQVNLANPDQAFLTARLPAAGVGLLRIEFLVANWIGIHPMALVHPERVPPEDRSRIAERTAGYADPADFFVERMASGIGVIAAAFWPRPVLVRFSDFKTNEYARLLGGAPFEPAEENPMIGFRGASRYYDPRYRDGFALECRAMRRVRETMGLTNVSVMIPFCRTITEAGRVLDELERNGLQRGKDGLAVWVMCEIPNNVVLAREFAELFDGFSIGSNDLTQLVLGVDRDSELLQHLFDERDPGVKAMIGLVVEQAHELGRPVGICGQAPSDHPGFAEWLASLGIDSISLTPDSLPGVARRLARSDRRELPLPGGE